MKQSNQFLTQNQSYNYIYYLYFIGQTSTTERKCWWLCVDVLGTCETQNRYIVILVRPFWGTKVKMTWHYYPLCEKENVERTKLDRCDDFKTEKVGWRLNGWTWISKFVVCFFFRLYFSPFHLLFFREPQYKFV